MKTRDSVLNATHVITKSGQELKLIKGASSAAGSALEGISKSSNRATYAMTNLSRVVQDAPYGFIGIANNLNPLQESFSSLVTETGSVRAAMGALGSSLFGAGGLGLAIGLASSLLVTFGDKLFSSGEDAKKAKEEVDKYTKAVEGLQDATLTARNEAESEIETVRRLAGIVRDSSQSYTVRKRALEELGSINENYFGELKLETLQYNDLESAVNKYASALINLKIKEKLSGQLADARIEMVKAKKAFDELQEKVNIREGNIRSNVYQNTNVRYRFDTGNTGDAPRKMFQDNLNAARKNDGILIELTKKMNAAGEEWGKWNNMIGEYSIQLDDALIKTLEFASTSGNASAEQRKAQQDAIKLLKEELERRKELQNLIDKANNDILDIEIQKSQRKLEQLKKRSIESLSAVELQERKTLEDKVYQLQVERLYRQYAAEEETILKSGKLGDELVEKGLKALKEKYAQDFIELRIKLKYYKPNEQGGYVNPFNTTTFSKDVQQQQSADITSGTQGMVPKISPSDANKGWNQVVANNDANKNDVIARQQEVDKYIADGIAQSQMDWIKTLMDLPQDAFIGIAEALGQGMSEGIGNALAKSGEAILHLIGGVIKKLGEYWIKTSAVVSALRKSLEGMLETPSMGLAAGIIAVAIGVALQNAKLQTQKPIKAFAEGGIVTGPMLGLVGEKGREAIIPLDRFDEVVGNRGSNNVFVTGQINGEIIYLQQQRVSQRRGRYN